MSTFNQTNIGNFVFEISDSGLTSAFTLNVQSSPLPNIRIPSTEIPGSTQGKHRAMIPGSSTEFDPLTVRFLVDEQMESWLSMYKWMLSINNYVNRDRSNWDGDTTATMHILDNNRRDIIMSLHYYGVWCSDLSEIEFSYTEDTDPAMICTAIIPFKYFEVEKDGQIVYGPSTDSESSNTIGFHPSMR